MDFSETVGFLKAEPVSLGTCLWYSLETGEGRREVGCLPHDSDGRGVRDLIDGDREGRSG